MTSFFTFKDYLENKVSSGVVIPRNKKLLKEDLDQFVKGNTTRSQVQILKRQLTKFVGPKPLLRNIGQRDFLSKIRTCETRDYVTKLHAERGRPLEKIAVSKNIEIASQKKSVSIEKRKGLDQISRMGKWKRRKLLMRKLESEDLELLESEQGNVSGFETLNYQKEAKMSQRDLNKTGELIKRKTGKKIVAGWRRRKNAMHEAMPEGIVVDDFKTSVSLQNGLNKSAERRIQREITDVGKKKILMDDQTCTLVVKVGQDGTTGIKEIKSNQVRLANLISKHVIPQIWCQTKYLFAFRTLEYFE